jgi:hypothetical protein
MSDLNKLRSALFDQLDAVERVDVSKPAEALLKLKKAEVATDICNSIIDSVKIELHAMKLMERRAPFTSFIPDDIGRSVFTAQHAAKLAAENRQMWRAKNADRIREFIAPKQLPEDTPT